MSTRLLIWTLRLPCRKRSSATCLEENASTPRDFLIWLKVFGWTVANHTDKAKVAQLINDDKINSLIYGFKYVHYYDHKDTRDALGDIARTVRANDGYRMANTNNPWNVYLPNIDSMLDETGVKSMGKNAGHGQRTRWTGVNYKWHL